MAEREQVLGRLLRAGGVHCRHARDALGRHLARIDDHEREALALDRAELVGGLLGEHQDRAVGAPVHQPLEERHLAIVLVERRSEDDSHVALVERLGGAAQHRAEVGVGHEREGQADHPGATAREAAGAAVRAEPVLAHDLQDILACLRCHVRPVVQHARDRGDRDAGQVGDVPNRGSAAERRVGVGVRLCHRSPY